MIVDDISAYSRPEEEWYLFPDQPIIDRCRRKEKPWFSYVVLPAPRTPPRAWNRSHSGRNPPRASPVVFMTSPVVQPGK